VKKDLSFYLNLLFRRSGLIQARDGNLKVPESNKLNKKIEIRLKKHPKIFIFFKKINLLVKIHLDFFIFFELC